MFHFIQKKVCLLLLTCISMILLSTVASAADVFFGQISERDFPNGSREDFMRELLEGSAEEAAQKWENLIEDVRERRIELCPVTNSRCIYTVGVYQAIHVYSQDVGQCFVREVYGRYCKNCIDIIERMGVSSYYHDH